MLEALAVCDGVTFKNLEICYYRIEITKPLRCKIKKWKVIFLKKAALIISVMLIVGTISACSASNETITFNAKVDSVSAESLMVTTDGTVEFDKASVSFQEGYMPSFEIQEGQSVIIEILPEIKESYPVQVTAVNITLGDEAEVTVYKKITPKEAKKLMDGSSVILDVRTQEEFDQGHIDGAILIPNTAIRNEAPNLLTDKNAVILVYCRSGRRSALAANELISMGYTQVYDFGGIIDWPYEIVK